MKNSYQWTTKMGSIIIAVETPPIAACEFFPSNKAAVAMKTTVAKVSKFTSSVQISAPPLV